MSDDLAAVSTVASIVPGKIGNDRTMVSPGSTFRVDQLRQVPDLHRLVPASRDQAPAIGAERHAADETRVAAEAANQLSGVAVPDVHGAVFACRGDPLAILVGAERQGVDLAVVLAPESPKFLAGL